MMNNFIRVCFVLCFISFFIFNINIFINSSFFAKKMIIRKYKGVVESSNYIAHALGGVDGNSYTNSLEAFYNSYDNGYRLFEVDISITSDNELVCSHGWKESDYKKMGLDYNADNPIMSLDEFLSIKIKGKYTSMSFSDLVELLKTHKDVFVLIDIGSKSYDDTFWIYKKIYDYCDGEQSILNHLITGGHTTDMIKAEKDVYDFPLINLYWSSDNVRQKELYEKEDFIEYCLENGITSLSVASNVYTEEWANYINDYLIIYVFTVNDEVDANNILEYADVVGTDFINL